MVVGCARSLNYYLFPRSRVNKAQSPVESGGRTIEQAVQLAERHEMKRLNWIVLSLSLVTIATLGLLGTWNVGARDLRLHVAIVRAKLFRVAPTDPS